MAKRLGICGAVLATGLALTAGAVKANAEGVVEENPVTPYSVQLINQSGILGGFEHEGKMYNLMKGEDNTYFVGSHTFDLYLNDKNGWFRDKNRNGKKDDDEPYMDKDFEKRVLEVKSRLGGNLREATAPVSGRLEQSTQQREPREEEQYKSIVDDESKEVRERGYSEARRGLRNTPWEYGLTDAQKLKLSELNTPEGKKIPYSAVQTSELDVPKIPERQVVEVHSSADDSTNGHTFSDKYVVDSKATPETEQTQRVQNPSVHLGQFGFSAGGFFGGGNGGVEVGASWEPLDGLGFTLTGLLGGGGNRVLEEITTPADPRGVYGNILREQQGLKLMGAAFDLRTGKTLYGVFGGEIINADWVETTTETITHGDKVITDSNSVPYRQISGAVRGGLELIFQKPGIGVGVIGKYNVVTKKPSLAVRISFRKPRNRGKK